MVKIVEYIWLDRDSELRSKIRIVDHPVENIGDVEVWNYDGSSTGQAQITSTEVILKPVFLCNNPFHDGFMVMCETYIPVKGGDVKAHPTNKRYSCATILSEKSNEPWFGIEQEYYMLSLESNSSAPIPFGYNPEKLALLKNDKYYCGTNIFQLKGQELAEEHMYHCIKAGIKIAGMNQESGPGQWEYQIGPTEGVTAADELWISRFILLRLAYRKGVLVSFQAKPLGDGYPGSGCHINFSTRGMREKGGINIISDAVEKLGKRHQEYIAACSRDNQLRLSGDYNTGMRGNFSHGVGTRNTSVRIPKDTEVKGCGYYEDRRPNADIDPYAILGFYV